jgi:hypothetical protein
VIVVFYHKLLFLPRSGSNPSDSHLPLAAKRFLEDQIHKSIPLSSVIKLSFTLTPSNHHHFSSESGSVVDFMSLYLCFVLEQIKCGYKSSSSSSEILLEDQTTQIRTTIERRQRVFRLDAFQPPSFSLWVLVHNFLLELMPLYFVLDPFKLKRTWSK